MQLRTGKQTVHVPGGWQRWRSHLARLLLQRCLLVRGRLVSKLLLRLRGLVGGLLCLAHGLLPGCLLRLGCLVGGLW